jgi:hypothetical protein
MHGREVLPNYAEKVVYRLGLNKVTESLKISAWGDTPSGRQANIERADVAPFSHLKLLMVNYQKKSLSPGCFTFRAGTALSDQQEQPTELDVSFSDLEESVNLYPHPNWTHQATYKFDIK